MIEITVSCPECGKIGASGKVDIDLRHGNMTVTCGECHVGQILGFPILGSSVMESRQGHTHPQDESYYTSRM